MTDGKRRRLSMLDSLAAAGSPAPPVSGVFSNRALRSARDAVDGHRIWDLDPDNVIDGRVADRLNSGDIADLRESIEANGQTVPILVRRHPVEPDRYLLVYGRRRLEAIRQSEKISKIRAVVANLDDDAALRSQISENTARRDLSFIEKALFARQLVLAGFGTQSEVAAVLTVTKSAISMALGVVDVITPELASAVGPAHGIGRPRWEALARAIEASGVDPRDLVRVAQDAARKAFDDGDQPPAGEGPDASTAAFEAVAKALRGQPASGRAATGSEVRPLHANGRRVGSLRRKKNGLVIDLSRGAFADWFERNAETMIQELHTRWKQCVED